MPVNFDLNDLYAFRALVEYGNFRLAAESICLSQPALSRRIDKLESALGLKLFERTTRRVTLTLKGQAFAERSGQLLADFEAVMADLSEVSLARTGLITVACVPSAAYYFMPNVIRSFQARYPRVRIKLIDSSAGNVYDSVMSGQADFGISFSGSTQPDIEFLPLLNDEYVAACRPEHAIAGKKSITWQEFYRHDWVGLDKTSGNRTLLDQALAEIAPERPSICETRHVTTMLGMVEAGLGIAAVPAMSMPLSAHSALTKVALTGPVVTRTVGLLRRSGRMLSHVAQELENTLIERYRSL
ncbi:LysR family transcriptional regulator [Franconibacter pulveris 1160]|uniref:LysR family transcriptional regulator n=2 Tax=Franconibacter TaxID=1649295 RepID=A0A0J8VQU4_9ENTR|nr:MULTISPECIES: LysR family transcriptional regulator [Franconibacter]KMV34885.1 LysR family transcriptional regulator [Franconibacter pulveris]MCK1967955.1 LysR family transcriptional regulator [Franconibacter sp. IITDAS19]MEB5920575.1 LysR family transcriptional regulator [Franconibacter daqui]GGD15777.1 LysR family transcriptional regulator [Franconibacter daqui]HBI09009.1 LysR family transcriptional regulator [Franconibacter pulveris]